MSFWVNNQMNSQVSWINEADEENDWAEKMIDFLADNKMNF